MMPGTSYLQKACDLDGKVGGFACGGVMGRLVGKARLDAVEVDMVGMGALCLSDFLEGKRGKVPWRAVWKGTARFACGGGGMEDVGFCPEMQHFRTKFPSGIGLPGLSEAENRK